MELMKSTTNRVLTGVCGGIADYFGWNAFLVRAAFLIFAFFGMGSTIVIYLILSFLM